MSGLSQSAILPEAGPFALYAILNVQSNKANVLSRLQELKNIVSSINQSQTDAQLCSSIAFGKSFWTQLYHQSPKDLTEFREFGREGTVAPATGGDVLLHFHSSRHDLNFYALRKLLEPIAEDIEVIEETHGFRYLDSRDMTEFVDGTENPKEAVREEVALIPDGEFVGGSYVMVQRFVHDLPAWNRLSVAAQEKVIGRTKPDSIELEDVPAASHVGRVDIKEEGKGLKIVRHSLPYGSVSGEHGLLFIAYCNTVHNFDAMLTSMYGEVDGKTDQMLRFTKAVSGAYFFAPSEAMLKELNLA